MRKIFRTAFLTLLFAASSAAISLAAKQLGAEDVRKELAMHYFRGVVNFEAGRYGDALNEFRAVSGVDPYYKDTPKYITETMKRLEKYRRDLLIPKGETRYDTKGVDLYFLGKMYYEKGDYGKALEAFKVVLDKDPADKFALYYAQLCEQALNVSGKATSKEFVMRGRASQVLDLAKETAYIKEDIFAQENMQAFLEEKVERRLERDDLIRKKERQVARQEALLDEAKKDYLAEAKLAKRAERLTKETEKWRRMKEKLASGTPGIPADLMEYPVFADKGKRYYVGMKEALRASRWNSAGLNAIQAALNYCDAILIYYYGIKSSYPEHENISLLMAQHIQRADVDDNIQRLRTILQVKALMEEEDRPLTRTEAIFLVEKTEQLIEWCRSILP